MNSSCRGLSLIEVLVALAVIALALAALISAAAGSAFNAAAIRDRTHASWVAGNVASELQLAPGLVEKGTRRGDEMLLGRRWYWRADISDTQDADLKRIDIHVSETADGDSVVLLTAFESRPFAPAPPQAQP